MYAYKIEATINSSRVKINKEFASRNDALDYMFKYLNRHYVYNFDLNEVYSVNNKHEIEYVSDNYNRFLISRVSL